MKAHKHGHFWEFVFPVTHSGSGSYPGDFGQVLSLPNSQFSLRGKGSSSCLVWPVRTGDQEEQDSWVGRQPFLFLWGCPTVPGYSWRVSIHLPTLSISQICSRCRGHHFLLELLGGISEGSGVGSRLGHSGVLLLLSKLCFVVWMFRFLNSDMKPQFLLNQHTEILAGFLFQKPPSSCCFASSFSMI